MPTHYEAHQSHHTRRPTGLENHVQNSPNDLRPVESSDDFAPGDLIMVHHTAFPQAHDEKQAPRAGELADGIYYVTHKGPEGALVAVGVNIRRDGVTLAPAVDRQVILTATMAHNFNGGHAPTHDYIRGKVDPEVLTGFNTELLTALVRRNTPNTSK